LFVSVDPRRDSPQDLASYTAAFGPRVVGLTGSQEQLQALTRRYRVTYGYGKTDDSGFYPVSHSSGVFVFDRDGKVRLLLREDLSAQQIAADLRRLLGG
ncbi:MAG: SCO family protein, partial [Salinisphaera sp.]|nr:SCO family protein [Salinisphaera sp.]